MSFVAWIAWSMLTWCPTTSLWRITEYGAVARAIAHATSEPDGASDLSGIASLESGYDPHARGKRGERGPWQLMAPVHCPPMPARRVDQAVLDCEARTALYRWKTQGAACYTGECANMGGDWPLARNRMWRGYWWASTHPFTPDARGELAATLSGTRAAAQGSLHATP